MLVCPVCRTRDEAGWAMHTVEPEVVVRAEGERILDGVLACVGAHCRRRYPVIDGIPILLRGLGSFFERQLVGLIDPDLSAEVKALVALAGPDDAPLARLVEHLGTYLDAHWGDQAVPPPDGPAPSPRYGLADLAERVAARATQAVGDAVELGCSVGRIAWELARGARSVTALDLSFASLRVLRRILAGQPYTYPRRSAGRHYASARITVPPPAAPVRLICGDALDPPLVPGAFERVVAFNLLDNVPRPAHLIAVVDGLTAPGGEVLLASPYTWQSGIVEEEERLGTADPAAEVRRRLAEGDGLSARYTVEDEAELLWWLRRDRRHGHAYGVHYLRARKPGQGG